MRRTISTIATLAALAAAAAATAAWAATTKTKHLTQTAASAHVTASFSYDAIPPKGRFGLTTYKNLRLSTARDGTKVYDQPVTSPTTCRSLCVPAVQGSGTGKSLSIRNLEGAGAEPDVVLELYTGGAHCCIVAQVFSFDATGQQYVKSEHDFGDPGYVLKRIGPGGAPVFVTADDNFAYAFTSYAESGLPLQILQFASGRFDDITRSYPKLIKKDAAMWLRIFHHHVHAGEGPLAAWAADEELLGHSKLVDRTLNQQLHAGHLAGGFVNGRKYISALKKLLRARGYIS